MRTAFLVSALAFVVPALSAPTLVPIAKLNGPVKPDSYIIKFKDNASMDSTLAKLIESFKGDGSSMTYDYSSLFKGVAATVKPGDLNLIRSMPEVEYIEPDAIVSLVDYVPDSVLDHSPPVAAPHNTLVSRAASTSSGQGVTVYGIDTGIYVEHECFGGRAAWGAVFGDYAQKDGNGHGTHTAGTAVGEGYGIATQANIIAVKVLGDDGSGSLSDVIAGIIFAFDDSQKKEGPAIVTMSLGASDPLGQSKSLDTIVQKAIAGGLHFTIAAGNESMDAKWTTPARVPEANTIGAVDSKKNNESASFSNHGKSIDVWAPGVDIKSAWIGNPKAENTISGTSMATPYVAGVLAVALGEHGQKSPDDLNKELKSHATPDVKLLLTAKLSGSNNLLAQKW